ncbi:MAG: DNA mismatch repair endonuclease MutL [Sphaerochaetaceae bacterium]|nr:DNA mismatch repair endonuclease MutL [Sphaerochaetaceae bacterium]
MGRINTLDSVVAARIAAGEVIDRPQSVARELIDNAIDAKASEITLTVEGGGIELLSVKDNGSGIEKDDLEKTIERHATSKISSVDDLYHLSTLGFRGEALYSVSAVSRLTIASSYMGEEAYTLIVDNGRVLGIKKGGPDSGTVVTVEDLFGQIPARRSFLKRPSSEATLVRNMLLSKAMAFPEITFRYYQDGALRLHLPARASRFDRVLDIITEDEKLNRKLFVELNDKGEKFSVKLVTSLAELHRSDRGRIKIYVNGRAVEEYSMVQAISYGYGERLPGGSFPYSVLFIEDDPELVDFNIHPAKKEVKLRNRAEIHHVVSSLIKQKLPRTIPSIQAKEDEQRELPPVIKTTTSYQDRNFFLNRSEVPQEENFSSSVSSPRKDYRSVEKPSDNSWLQKAKELAVKKEEREIAQSYEKSTNSKESVWDVEDNSFTYIGQAFKLFLICERKGKLYLVDQHAAHERVIFEELKEQRSVQQLLVPIDFEVERDVDEFLSNHADLYTQYGINIVRKEDCLWSLLSLPAMARPVEKQLVEYISTKTGDESELESGLYAIVACKAAIKAGDIVDRYSAEALLEKTFQLEDPSCPHGRTFIITLDEADLRKMVGRTK